MDNGSFGSFVMLSGVLVVLLPSTAAHAETCTSLRMIGSSDGLSQEWQQALKALERDIESAGVSCGDVAIALVAKGKSVAIEVTAPDGRHARRIVAVPTELTSVTMGLLASIPSEEDSQATSPSVTANEPPPPPPPPPPLATRTGVPASSSKATSGDPTERPRGPAEIGLTFGTRVGFPTGVISPELDIRGDVRFGSWIVGLTARGAPAGTRLTNSDPPGYEFAEYSFGALFGRHVVVASGELSVAIGPRIGIIDQESDDVAATTRTSLWLQGSIHYVIPVGDRWRPVITADLETAPHLGSVSRADPSLPPFPSWSASLRLGFAGDLL